MPSTRAAIEPTGNNALRSIPSRHDNPFATCWTQPGALAYHFAPGETPAKLVDRLQLANWRGQIVGPHGTGKSTLLVTLIRELRRRGICVFPAKLRQTRRRLPTAVFQARRSGLPAVLVVDGYEQLTILQRMLLAFRCWHSVCGLLVTTHRPIHLPVIARTTPNLATVHQLVSALMQNNPLVIAHSDVSASFARHNGNVREILFDLYDRYERAART